MRKKCRPSVDRALDSEPDGLHPPALAIVGMVNFCDTNNYWNLLGVP